VKYAAIITSGLAEPVPPRAAPGAHDDHEPNRSPLRDAPAIQRLADAGRIGRVAALPPGAEPDFATALAALLGLDTLQHPISTSDGLRALDGDAAARPPSFKALHGLDASLITADPAALGLARLLDMTPIKPSADEPTLADLAAIAREELETNHAAVVAAPNLERTPETIADLDEHLVAPLAHALGLDEDLDPSRGPGARLLLVTLPAATSDDPRAPAPFLLAGDWVRAVIPRPFTELSAAESDLLVDPGCDLMEYVLFGGLKRTIIRPAAKSRTTSAPSQ